MRRQNDPSDRRKVIIVPLYENNEVGNTYLPLHAEMLKLASAYSDEELELITQFVGKASTVLDEQIHRLHSTTNNNSST